MQTMANQLRNAGLISKGKQRWFENAQEEADKLHSILTGLERKSETLLNHGKDIPESILKKNDRICDRLQQLKVKGIIPGMLAGEADAS